MYLRNVTPRTLLWTILGALAFMALSAPVAQADPPFGGTIYAVPGLLNDSDPSTFDALAFEAVVQAEHFDHRPGAWVRQDFFRFRASFADGQVVTFDVNVEFADQRKAHQVARLYALILGQIPVILRQSVVTVVVHATGADWSAGSGEINIHHGNYEADLALGILEESMIHEGAHLALDALHERAPGWRRAQERDDAFISDYAATFPRTEDVAESFVTYLAMTSDPDRVPDTVRRQIAATIPARLAYFDEVFTAGSLWP